MKASVRSVLSLLVAIGLFGCASHKTRALTPQPIEAYPVQATVNDVRIAVEPLETQAETEGAFTLNVTTKGYVPVLLVMENRSRDNVLVIKEEIELVDSQGNVLKAIPAQVMAEEFEHDAMAMALLGFGIFSYMSAQDANDEMVKDWSGKEMPAEKVLMPYRKTHGVVYFHVGPGLAALPNSTLHIPLRNMRTGHIHSVRLAVARGTPVPDVEGTAPKMEGRSVARLQESAKPVPPTLRDWLLGEWVGTRKHPWYEWDATIRITAYDPATHAFKGDGYLVDKGGGSGFSPPRTDLVIKVVIDDEGRIVMTTHHSSGSYPGRSFTFNLKRERDGRLSGTPTHGGSGRLILEKKQ